MTETPLHRAARALMKSQSGVDDFDALDDEMQKGLLDDVRAVLSAMREPNEVMIEAAWYNLPSLYDQDVKNSKAFAEQFAAVIDAALSE